VVIVSSSGVAAPGEGDKPVEQVGEGDSDGAGRGIGAEGAGTKSLKWEGNQQVCPDKVEGIE
jgi:hypothetical protein